MQESLIPPYPCDSDQIDALIICCLLIMVIINSSNYNQIVNDFVVVIIYIFVEILSG